MWQVVFNDGTFLDVPSDGLHQVKGQGAWLLILDHSREEGHRLTAMFPSDTVQRVRLLEP